MATQFDVTALTLNPLEATDVSEAVMEKVFVQTELNAIHNIETGVQMKSQIVFVEKNMCPVPRESIPHHIRNILYWGTYTSSNEAFMFSL